MILGLSFFTSLVSILSKSINHLIKASAILRNFGKLRTMKYHYLMVSYSEAKRVMDSVRKNVRVKPKVFRISKERSPSSPYVSSNQMTVIDDQSQQRSKELPGASNPNDQVVPKSSFELTIRNQLL